LWAAERHRQNETTHLDEMLVKLANIATRVKKSRFEDVRHDLVQAIQLFWAKGSKLKKVNLRHEGSLDWWARRTKTLNTVQWVSSDMQDPDDDEAVESRPSAAVWESTRHRADVHPRHREMATSRLNEVKAPQHRMISAQVDSHDRRGAPVDGGRDQGAALESKNAGLRASYGEDRVPGGRDGPAAARRVHGRGHGY
jgi:hypothetical protein